MAFTAQRKGEGKIVEKLFKNDSEKSYNEFNDIHFEFSKKEKSFMKFKKQIGLVFTILMNQCHLFIDKYVANLIVWNFHLLGKLLKAHRIQREFNEKSESFCQQTEMANLEKRMNSKMNNLENKLEEILSFQKRTSESQKKTSEILTELSNST